MGSKLLVFYVPFRPSIYLEEWETLKRNNGLSEEKWNVEQVGIELEKVCRRNNILCFNPTGLFKREAGKLLKTRQERLYYAKDGHWNVGGHKFAGEILAEQIKHNE